MPRLLSINSYHYRRGGSDAVYFDHAALMEELGWANAFFSMHHPQNERSEWSRYFVNELEYAHAHKYLFWDKLKMITKVVYSFEAKRNIQRLIADFRPDIAHAHCIYHHLSPSILPAIKKLGIPIVMTAHELKAICPAATMLNSKGSCERCKNGNILNVILHKCIKNSLAPSIIVAMESLVHRCLDTYKKNIDKIITPSHFYMDKYAQWGWPLDRLVYIPNFVDSSQFQPQFDPGTYFLYFGRLSVEKGLLTLVRAVSEARIHMKIIGAGPLEKPLKDIAAELKANIQFLGYRRGSDLHDLIRSAKTVILPSEGYENAPISILESYALGKPVIGARIGGIPELIKEGYTGWTFESGNAEELVHIIEHVNQLSQKRLYSMGQAARDLVALQFNRSRYLEGILSVYSQLGIPN